MRDFTFDPEKGYYEVEVIEYDKERAAKFAKETGFIIPDDPKKKGRVNEKEYSIVKIKYGIDPMTKTPLKDEYAVVPTHQIIKIELGENELSIISKNIILGYIKFN